MRSKDTHQTHCFLHFIMTRSIALSLLAQGNNGNEILSILDSIAADNVEIDIIEFW